MNTLRLISAILGAIVAGFIFGTGIRYIFDTAVGVYNQKECDRVVSYIESEWSPLFLENFREAARMDEIESLKLAYSFETDQFVEVSENPEVAAQQRKEAMEVWQMLAEREISLKYIELLDKMGCNYYKGV